MKRRDILGVILLSFFIVILIVGTYLVSAKSFTGTWYAGDAPPLPRMIAGWANNGDYYINLDTNTVYQYMNGTWTETSNPPPNTNFSLFGAYVAVFIVGFIGAVVTPVVAWHSHRT